MTKVSALDLMAKLEGKTWLENQREATGSFSFAHLYEGYQKLNQSAHLARTTLHGQG